MTSLLDIAPPEIATKDIPITRGGVIQVLTVRGLSSLDLVKLMKRFPSFRKRAAAGARAAAGKTVQTEDDDDEMMMDGGLEATPAVIAMGLGSYDPETEKMVDEKLTIDEQAEMVTAIMLLTNPDAPKTSGPLAELAPRRKGGGEESGKVLAGT